MARAVSQERASQYYQGVGLFAVISLVAAKQGLDPCLLSRCHLSLFLGVARIQVLFAHFNKVGVTRKAGT